MGKIRIEAFDGDIVSVSVRGLYFMQIKACWKEQNWFAARRHQSFVHIRRDATRTRKYTQSGSFEQGKYALTIWPYHAMLGGIGHALVSAVEEALFFHSIARNTQYEIEIKGNKPFTEYYSAIGPEVLTGPMGESLGTYSTKFIEQLQQFDKLIIAGQAKSHCVAWTVSDLLNDISATDQELAKKVFLLEDCSSPVVVPGVVDHTEAADAAYERFARAGMHIIKSTDEF